MRPDLRYDSIESQSDISDEETTSLLGSRHQGNALSSTTTIGRQQQHQAALLTPSTILVATVALCMVAITGVHLTTTLEQHRVSLHHQLSGTSTTTTTTTSNNEILYLVPSSPSHQDLERRMQKWDDWKEKFALILSSTKRWSKVTWNSTEAGAVKVWEKTAEGAGKLWDKAETAASPWVAKGMNATEAAAKKTWEATEAGAEKAWEGTEKVSGKVWNKTELAAEDAWHKTEEGAEGVLHKTEDAAEHELELGWNATKNAAHRGEEATEQWFEGEVESTKRWWNASEYKAIQWFHHEEAALGHWATKEEHGVENWFAGRAYSFGDWLHNQSKPEEVSLELGDDMDLIYLNESTAFHYLTTGNGWFDFSSDYFLIQQGWDAQQNQAYCPVATSASIINSFRGLLATLPMDPLYDPYPYATQNDLLETPCTDATVIMKNESYDGIFAAPGGLGMAQTKALLECHLPSDEWRVKAVHVDPTDVNMTLNDMRKEMILALHDPLSRVMVNYYRKGVGQIGGGHWSPIGSYSPVLDAFLIMDVAKYKYPAVWVSAVRLFSALQTVDTCGSWDFPLAQNKLAEVDLLHPKSEDDYTTAMSTLGCQPTYRGYMIVTKLSAVE